ncbi:hypothetical protein [Ralstonia phage RSF1]|uniref:Uncharacterized protein n=1 Tax=Ralstonia phage RSF1 TaxID=1689679 RepID=A0A0K2QQX8_9CAUD|nr:hypothetical protein AVU11_agp40 [Ralstonia phage RSF1]BAS04987.2 hypothetical protein [Ralstonia phage RSF1]
MRAEDKQYNPANVILDAMTTARLPNVVDAELFMRMKYETAFGIYNHDAPDTEAVPWPLLFCSPLEDLSVVDPIDFRLDQFAENRVHEIFGLSFDELIHYPRRDFLKVINSAKKHSAKLFGAGSSLLKNLERQLSQTTPTKPPAK